MKIDPRAETVPELVYRVRLDVTDDLRHDGERGVERLVERLREFGFPDKIRRRRTGGRTWLTTEYHFDVDDPTWVQDAWPYEFTDAMRDGSCEVLSVTLRARQR